MQLEQEQLKKLKIEAKYFNILGVLIFLCFAIVSYFLLDYFFKQVDSKKIIADSKQLELDKREDNIIKIKELKNNVPDFPEKVNILDNIKNDQQSFEQLISQLEKLASAAGLDLPSITPDANNLSSLQVAFSVTGDYASIKKFLNALENNQLIINVVDMSVSGSEPSLTLSLTVKTGN